MNRSLGHLVPWLLVCVAAPALAEDDDDDYNDPVVTSPAPPAPPVSYKPRVEINFESMDVQGDLFRPNARMMSATPGGSQDIGFFRDVVERGGVPYPAVITAEGLFSEHDLDIGPAPACDRLFCPVGKATETVIPAQPDVAWLAQLGFTSAVAVEKFERPPLQVIAVVDRSCSMTGDKFETVRASLRTLSSQLGPQDRLGIVTYGSNVDVELAPTPGKQDAIANAISALDIDGSTNMEAGLTTGFDLARQSRKDFDGTTRVMLFTDEQPNTGRTDARSFMGMATDASHSGIGLTTIGVGTDFGAELAQQISAVRGGNLYFFPNVGDMQEKFAEDLDTMVVELAYDVSITLTPADGTRIAGLYGIPGEAFHWTEGGGLVTTVSTLFASKEGGAIYVAFAPVKGGSPPHPGGAVGHAILDYTPRDGGVTRSEADFTWVPAGRAPDGLVRGRWLVDEFTTLRAATRDWHEGRPDQARKQISELARRLDPIRDQAASADLDLVRSLEHNLGGAPVADGSLWGAPTDAVSGLPAFGVALH